jgi:hypothetical protein
LQVRGTIDHQWAIKRRVILVGAEGRSIQIKSAAKKLKTAAMRVNDLAVNGAPGINIADRNRCPVLSFSCLGLGLPGAGDAKECDETRENPNHRRIENRECWTHFLNPFQATVKITRVKRAGQ